jgi:hypothetical protein
MMLIAASEAERARIEFSIRRSVVSFVATAVAYLLPASMEVSELVEIDGVGQAEAGVVLVGVDGERVIRWSMEGQREASWLGKRWSNEGLLWAPDVWRVPADSRWRDLVGEPIVHVAVGWQRVSVDLESVWSLRLDTASGSVVVALGEIDWESERLWYIPDCVVAIFDEELANDYRPRSSAASAWGTESPSN